ncbi:hypothetical protein [Novosphingobium panipatense]|uniref:hypothetical protein n=1 Tax=Novosphingobium panipatense TaxID=428991 RepID=UPI00361F6CAA
MFEGITVCEEHALGLQPEHRVDVRPRVRAAEAKGHANVVRRLSSVPHAACAAKRVTGGSLEGTRFWIVSHRISVRLGT